MDEIRQKLRLLGKYKYPLLIFLLGVLLLLTPGSQEKEERTQNEELRLEEILSATRGVGQARVLLSEEGVIVVCEGASNAAVRLDMICALSSYTGFGSDRITILQMAK